MGGSAAAAEESGEGVGAGGAEEGGGSVRAKGAEVAGAGGVKGPVSFGLGPEVDFGVVIVGTAAEEEAVIDFFEIQ